MHQACHDERLSKWACSERATIAKSCIHRAICAICTLRLRWSRKLGCYKKNDWVIARFTHA